MFSHKTLLYFKIVKRTKKAEKLKRTNTRKHAHTIDILIANKHKAIEQCDGNGTQHAYYTVGWTVRCFILLYSLHISKFLFLTLNLTLRLFFSLSFDLRKNTNFLQKEMRQKKKRNEDDKNTTLITIRSFVCFVLVGITR